MGYKKLGNELVLSSFKYLNPDMHIYCKENLNYEKDIIIKNITEKWKMANFENLLKRSLLMGKGNRPETQV